jgi:hypothetical protein
MPAVQPPLEPLTDPTDAATVTSTVHASWYDPDASSWEPQPAALFEALRASAPRPAIAVGTGRPLAGSRSAAARTAGPTGQA